MARQNIGVGRPVIQEGMGVIIPVNEYMLRSVEILDLKRRGRLDLEGIKDYATEVQKKSKNKV